VETRAQCDLISFFSDQRPLHSDVEVQEVIGKEVGQVAVLCVVPDMLDGIEFRRIGRQPFDVEPVGMGFGDPASGAAMHVPAVPNQDGPAMQVPSKIAQKIQHVRRSDVLLVDRKEQAQMTTTGTNGQCAQHRQPIMPVPRVGDRRLSLRCPGVSRRLKRFFRIVGDRSNDLAVDSDSREMLITLEHECSDCTARNSTQ